MAKPLHEDISRILSCADNSALKKGQTYINTAGLFDGTLRLFAIKKEYNELSTKIKEVLGKYSINSQKFNEAFEDLFPSGTELPKTVDVELSDDAGNVINTLYLKAQTEKRVQTVEDFVSQLFSNKSYKLFFVLSRVADRMKEDYDAAVDAGTDEGDLPPTSFDVNLLYADLQKVLAKATCKEIQSLETDEMKKYLTNINKYVASRKDFKLVGMQKELLALEVALAGRTKKSACLVGNPGTGKTSLLYELANRINNGDVSDLLKGTVIYEMHMDALVAG